MSVFFSERCKIKDVGGEEKTYTRKKKEDLLSPQACRVQY